MEIRRSTTGFPILVRRHLYIELASECQDPFSISYLGSSNFTSHLTLSSNPTKWLTEFPASHFFMMTSSNGNIFCVTGPLCGEFTGEFPSQRPVTQNFDVFFDLHLNKRLSKQWWGWWFEMPLCLLWRLYNVEWLHKSLGPKVWLAMLSEPETSRT